MGNPPTPTYTGIDFNNSSGIMLSNTITGSNYGIYCESYSSPWSGAQGQKGANVITNNLRGVVAYNNSMPSLGYGYLNPKTGYVYEGTCNSIYNNTQYNVQSSSYSSVTAEYDWWGQYPPDATKFLKDGTSTIDYNNALTSSDNCPIGLTPVAQQVNLSNSPVNGTEQSPTDPTTLFKLAIGARMSGDYNSAASIYRTLLKDTTVAADKQRALVLLYNVFQESGDSTIVGDLLSYSKSSGQLGEIAEELLAYAYAATKQIFKAEFVANDLIARYGGTDVEKRALILLASLRAFDPSASQISSAALNELETKFGSSVDAGLIAALTTQSDASSNGSVSQNMKGIISNDTLSTKPGKFEIENYPNPFNPSTVISYQLPVNTFVMLKVYDALGREVKALVNEDEPAGYHNIVFDGSSLPSGLYFYRLTAGKYTSVKKLMLVK